MRLLAKIVSHAPRRSQRIHVRLQSSTSATANVLSDAAVDTSYGRTTEGYQWSNVYEEAHDMMMASFVSYPITFLLRESRAGRLRHSDRILEKLKAGTDGNMATALYPHDFVEIVQDNLRYIQANYQDPKEFGWYSVMQLYNQMEHSVSPQDNDSIALLEFDDKQENTRLVYGIGVNKPLKRITVIFRGTYAENTRDWARNLQFNLVKVPIPEDVQDSLDPSGGNTNLFVHRGIYEYLLHNSERGPDYPRERYEEILGHILNCLQQYPDYKVYVTGHSLGGALALLLAFFASADDRLPKPITCVSLGSLLVGDATFRTAFQQLEAKGWLRHLRITNQHDPVPCLPPFQWYQPQGMHLQLLQDSGYQLGHQAHNNENSFRGLYQSYKATGATPTEIHKWFVPHGVPEYLKRLEREKASLQNLYLNQCYRDPNYVGHEFTTRL